MGDYLDDMAACGDRAAIAEQARRSAVRSVEGRNQEMLDKITAVVADYMCQRDETRDLGESADIAMCRISQIMGMDLPEDGGGADADVE